MINAIKELRAKAELDAIYAKAKLDFADELLAKFEAVETAEPEIAETEAECADAPVSEFGNI